MSEISWRLADEGLFIIWDRCPEAARALAAMGVPVARKIIEDVIKLALKPPPPSP